MERMFFVFSDKRTRGFTKNGKALNDLRNLYSLNYSRSSVNMNINVKNAYHALITLAQKTSIFGKSFDYNNGKNLLKNDDVFFVGTLLLRLVLVYSINSFDVSTLL